MSDVELLKTFSEKKIELANSPLQLFIQKILKHIRRQKGYDDSHHIDYMALLEKDGIQFSTPEILDNFKKLIKSLEVEKLIITDKYV